MYDVTLGTLTHSNDVVCMLACIAAFVVINQALGGGVFALGGAAAGESGFPRGGLYVPAADFRRDSVAAAGGSKQRRAASALRGGAGDDLREHRGGQPRAAAGGGKNKRFRALTRNRIYAKM